MMLEKFYIKYLELRIVVDLEEIGFTEADARISPTKWEYFFYYVGPSNILFQNPFNPFLNVVTKIKRKIIDKIILII